MYVRMDVCWVRLTRPPPALSKQPGGKIGIVHRALKVNRIQSLDNGDRQAGGSQSRSHVRLGGFKIMYIDGLMDRWSDK